MNNSHDTLYIGKHYIENGSLGDAESYKKIGITGKGEADIFTRANALSRTKSPIKWIPLHAWKFDCDARHLETALHKLLADRRLDGEWFTDENDNLIEAVTNFVSLFNGKPIDLNTTDTDSVNVKIRNTVGAKNANNDVAFGIMSNLFDGVKRRNTDNPSNWVAASVNGTKHGISVNCNTDSFSVSTLDIETFCEKYGYLADMKRKNARIRVSTPAELTKLLEDIKNFHTK